MVDALSLSHKFDDLQKHIENSSLAIQTGRITRVIGTLLHGILPDAKVGERYALVDRSGQEVLHVEVIGFEDNAALLTPLGEVRGITVGDRLKPLGDYGVPVGEELMGRVLDANGVPIDGKGPVQSKQKTGLHKFAPSPMTRILIEHPLPVGIRAVDAFLTVGLGQRVGVFAAAGGGKSTLFSMLIRNSPADVNIVCLIGERGREVREFVEYSLGEDGLKRTIVVVATSDRPSIEQVNSAFAATAMAEYFRDQGLSVVLLMDSVTRFCRAQREIGLAAGEPPTRRGFPPSVFSTLPRLVERVGNNEHGSITAFYSVLMEGDDMTEPVSDETRSLLDGHIILSRPLAAGGHYPAISVLDSVSRVMNSVVTEEHVAAANVVRGMMATYKEVELLIKVGEYRQGKDEKADIAVARHNDINKFLRQGMREYSEFEETLYRLGELASA